MKVFITGGAGFIGSNSADYYLNRNDDVTVFDNLSRPGSRLNLDWLHERHGDRLTFVHGDVRNYEALSGAIHGADVVLHLASQVAVTTSVENPREDFEINTLGTFNVVEAVRSTCPGAALVYASTNKVYGGLEDASVVEDESRYRFSEYEDGISESFGLDFHSPYGCSKGAGDQYVIDYARIYGLRTASLRQSCIYGRRQFGIEDQGWVAHFVIAACLNRPITIYGNGKQVRDILHVSDLINAYDLAIKNIDEISGSALNIGGGPDNTITIWTEFRPILESLLGKQLAVNYEGWRPGDQRVFISNIALAKEQLGWQPKIAPIDGIGDLFEWVSAHPSLFR